MQKPESGLQAGPAYPSRLKRMLINTSLSIPGIRKVVASLLPVDSSFNMQKLSELIVHPNTDFEYQKLRNRLCKRLRGKLRGEVALPALEVLSKAYETFSARREQELREKKEEMKNRWGVWLSMVTIRCAVADVLKGTDHKPILSVLAKDLRYEWNEPTAKRVFDAMGERAKTDYLDDALPCLSVGRFGIRECVAEALTGTENTKAQCAMVHALQDSSRFRIEECTAGLWGAATRTIQVLCESLMGTRLSEEARQALREGIFDEYAAFFCSEVLSTGYTKAAKEEAERVVAREPDRFMKMQKMMAEMTAAEIVRKEARAAGVEEIDWNAGPWAERWEELLRKMLKGGSESAEVT